MLTDCEDIAYAMLKANPTLLLSAETVGKMQLLFLRLPIDIVQPKTLFIQLFQVLGKMFCCFLEDEVYEYEEF